MRANEIRLRSRSGVDRRFGESVGEGEVCQPDGAVRRPEEQVRIRFQVGVETQGGAAHDDSHVIAVIGRGEFGSDQSAQPSQPAVRRAPRRTSP